jgi:hypothetical protein
MDAERRQAILEGRGRYFTGRPCAHGHVAERGTVNGYCVECARLARQTDHGRKRANAASRRHYRRKHPEMLTGSAPILGVPAVRECADDARSRGRTGTRTTGRRKAIVGTMAATDFADNDAQPIKGRMATVDPRDVAKFMRWRDAQR